MRRMAAMLVALAMSGCPEAPDELVLDGSPTQVPVGAFEVNIKLPQGIEHHQTTKASTRYAIPGRGGAIVHLSVSTATPNLADWVKRTKDGAKVNGAAPIIVRQEMIKDRIYMTTKGAKGWAVAASSWIPLPAGSAGPHTSLVCRANVYRSRPIVDLEGTQKTLESICESVSFVP